jgi:hypothetical protein
MWTHFGRVKDERLLSLRAVKRALAPGPNEAALSTGFQSLRASYGQLMELLLRKGEGDKEEVFARAHRLRWHARLGVSRRRSSWSSTSRSRADSHRDPLVRARSGERIARGNVRRRPSRSRHWMVSSVSIASPRRPATGGCYEKDGRLMLEPLAP